MVIFTQSVQQQKQFNILPSADKWTPPTLDDYFKSRSAALKFSQISVICQEVPQIFALDPNLAKEYKVISDFMSRAQICEHNRDVCSKFGKAELANMWDVLASVAVLMEQFDSGMPDAFPMSQFPLGRPLVEYYIEHFLQRCDMQTVAMIVSVFFEDPQTKRANNSAQISLHTDCDAESEDTKDFELSRQKSFTRSGFESPEFALETTHGLASSNSVKKLSSKQPKVSLTSADFPDQFKRDDLNFGPNDTTDSLEYVCS